MGDMEVEGAKETDFDVYFQKRRHKLLSQVSDYQDLVLYTVFSENLDGKGKPDRFEIVDSFEENVFFILAHIKEKQQVRFYKCRIVDDQRIFSISLTEFSGCVNIQSFEFLKQENLTLPKICSSSSFPKNPEAEKFKEIIKKEFNKEIISLDKEGNLKIYKGNTLLLTLRSDVEILRLLGEFHPRSEFITQISNPQKSRLTLHFGDEAKRVDFQFKGKLRDYNLLSCLHVIHKILPLHIYQKFFQHFLYQVFIFENSMKTQAWKVFTDLFFTLLDRKTKKEAPVPTPKKSAFEQMLASKTAQKLMKGLKPVIKIPKVQVDEQESEICYEKLYNIFTPSDIKEFQKCDQDMFEVLHLLHEDYKLNVFNHKLLTEGSLVEFLFRFCLKMGPSRFNYSEFYAREHPSLAEKYSKEYEQYKKLFEEELSAARTEVANNILKDQFVVPGIFNNIATVPSIYSWIEAKLNPEEVTYDGNFICFFETTRKVGRLFDIFTQDKEVTKSKIHPLLRGAQKDEDMEIEECRFLQETTLFGITPDQPDYVFHQNDTNLLKRIVLCLKEEKMGRDSIKKLPLGISIPIQEVLSHEYFKTIYVRSSDQEKKAIQEWPKEIFKLIEREDLYYNLKELKRTNDFSEDLDSEFQFSRASSFNINKGISKRKSVFKLGRTESNVFAGGKQSLVNDRASIAKSKQSPLGAEGTGTQDYMDLIDKEFQRLGLKNNKISNMVGKVSEGNFISYRFSSDLRYMEVSLMLDSSIPFKLRIDSKEFELISPDQSEEKKQFMHRSCVIRQYAKCVGRGALKLGTIQTVPTEKLKIPEIKTNALLPPSNKEIELRKELIPMAGWADFHNGVATGLQLATEFDPFSNEIKNWILYHRPQKAQDEFGGFLMSMGFHGYLKHFQKIEIYQYMKTKYEAYTVGICLGGAASLIGTGDEDLTNALRINVSVLHPRNFDIEISTPSQCAALVGYGLLYKGSNNRSVTEMLLSQIGKRPSNSKTNDREGYALSAGFGLGLIHLGCGTELPGMTDLEVDERLIRFVEGGKNMPEIPAFKSADGPEDQCSSIREGENVNLYVTLPAGLVSLALIHLKTNNRKIADKITLPQNFFSLEKSIPSDVMMKVLCRNLILWDSIEATDSWVRSQIPDIIYTIYNTHEIETVEKLYQTRIKPEEIDYANISMLYTYFFTGALFSIGFKYAGSGNRDVFKFLCDHVEKLINMKVTNSNSFKPIYSHKYTNRSKNDIDSTTYQTCLCVSAYAISMVMAGTGDVDAFVTLRRIRKILEQRMHYGFNMAIHMAIGFLFLGSGKYTFSTSNLSIAALLMALYPRFPEESNDNRYHLQALRHFYVLAIESKLLQTIDVETGELVSVPLEIKYKDPISEVSTFGEAMPSTRSVKTPIMLEDIHKISSIHLNDKKYYKFVIDKPEFSRLSLQKGSQSVFKRASYVVDQPELQSQKSVSKVSYTSPFEIYPEKEEFKWIPKMIYVKKRIQLETQENTSDKIILSPFEFSQQLSKISIKKGIDDMASEAEGEEDVNEQSSTQIEITSSIPENKEFSEISEITKNQLLQKFLQNLCYYDNVVYSELEPLVTKGSIGRLSEGESYSSRISPQEFMTIMSETEDLADNLEEDCNLIRTTQKLFNLRILHECFNKNRIEILPIYLRLFSNSLDLKTLNNPTSLLKQSSLILSFYQGLYQRSFTTTEPSQESPFSDSKNDPLISTKFLEELSEVIASHYQNSEITKEILSQNYGDGMTEGNLENISCYLGYKKYPLVSQLKCLVTLIEVTQGLTLEEQGETIRDLVQQKFRTKVDLEILKGY